MSESEIEEVEDRPLSGPDFPAFSSKYASGLTKREFIAAIALQGICANPGIDVTWVETARMAINAADALLTELEED